MTLRSLAGTSAVYTIGNFLPRVGSFLLVPIYVRFLTREEYGTVSLVTALAAFLAIVFRLGMEGALMRLHFDETGRRQRALYSTLTSLVVLASLAGSLIGAVALAPFFRNLFSGVSFVPYGLLGIGIAAASAASFAPGVFFRATGQASRFLMYTVAIFAVSSVASVVFVVVGLGAVGMLGGQLAGALFGLGLTVVLVARIAGVEWQQSLVAPALRFGLPLVPHLVSAWALRLADRILIGLLIGLPAAEALGQLGAYSLGYQLGYVITVLVSSFNAAWSPWFFSIADRPGAPAIFSRMTTIVMAALFVVGVGAAALSPQIVAVIARPEYASAATVLPIVAMASVVFAFYTMLTTVVFYAKATGRLALITVSAAIINVAANVVLIPALGITGAAWATLIGYVFFAVATWRYATTVYPVRLDVSRLAVLAAAAAIALIAANLSGLTASDEIRTAIRLAAVAIFSVVALTVAMRPIRDLVAQTTR